MTEFELNANYDGKLLERIKERPATMEGLTFKGHIEADVNMDVLADLLDEVRWFDFDPFEDYELCADAGNGRFTANNLRHLFKADLCYDHFMIVLDKLNELMEKHHDDLAYFFCYSGYIKLDKDGKETRETTDLRPFGAAD